jgi:SAM-dependent methyltransferase
VQLKLTLSGRSRAPEILARIHAAEENIVWLYAGGSDLGFLSSGMVDFVFSCLGLQHLPSRELAVQYIQEMLRILRHDVVFLFQFNRSNKSKAKGGGDR